MKSYPIIVFIILLAFSSHRKKTKKSGRIDSRNLKKSKNYAPEDIVIKSYFGFISSEIAIDKVFEENESKVLKFTIEKSTYKYSYCNQKCKRNEFLHTDLTEKYVLENYFKCPFDKSYLCVRCVTDIKALKDKNDKPACNKCFAVSQYKDSQSQCFVDQGIVPIPDPPKKIDPPKFFDKIQDPKNTFTIIYDNYQSMMNSGKEAFAKKKLKESIESVSIENIKQIIIGGNGVKDNIDPTVIKSPLEKKATFDFIDSLKPNQGFYILPALEKALENTDANNQIIIISDGEPSDNANFTLDSNRKTNMEKFQNYVSTDEVRKRTQFFYIREKIEVDDLEQVKKLQDITNIKNQITSKFTDEFTEVVVDN